MLLMSTPSRSYLPNINNRPYTSLEEVIDGSIAYDSAASAPDCPALRDIMYTRATTTTGMKVTAGIAFCQGSLVNLKDELEHCAGK